MTRAPWGVAIVMGGVLGMFVVALVFVGHSRFLRTYDGEDPAVAYRRAFLVWAVSAAVITMVVVWLVAQAPTPYDTDIPGTCSTTSVGC